MSSTYRSILYPTTHLRNTHHWPHVQYVQSYHYIISHHPLTEHVVTDHMSSTYSPIAILDPTIHVRNMWSLTTCPVRTVLSLYWSHIHLRNTHWPHVQYVQSFTILYPTIHLRNTQHWPHVQYVQSYHYINISTYGHTHWPHVQYVQSCHCIISHHPLTKHTDWPHVQYVCPNHYIMIPLYVLLDMWSVMCVSYSIWWDPIYGTHVTDHMSSTYSPNHYIIYHRTTYWTCEHTALTTCPVRTVLSLYYIPPSSGTHSTDHMSSTYSPFTILDPTTHLETHALTTCPVRTVLSLYSIPPPTYKTHSTDHMSSTYRSLYYIPPPTYETHITDHMSSTYSPITILYPTIHLRKWMVTTCPVLYSTGHVVSMCVS